MKVGVALTDLCTGLYMHGAIMAALLQRGSSGKGQRIEADLLSTQVCLLRYRVTPRGVMIPLFTVFESGSGILKS